MYTIYLDDAVLYYPGDPLCVVMAPVVKRAVGKAGSFECLVPPVNPLWGSFQNRKSMITVYKGSKEIFYGEVRDSGKDKHNCRNVYAVGMLAFLVDSIQPQTNYGDCTPTTFLTGVISNHNSQVEERKQISRGYVTVPSGYDASEKITDLHDSLTEIRSNLVNNLGGCLRIRKTSGVRYLDYVPLNDYGSSNSQGINFGENLLDYSENLTASDIVTAVIPLGARVDSEDDFEKRVDITSVNSGLNYVTASSSVLNRFGYVWKVVVFDGITSPSDLKAAGQQYITENQYETLSLKVSAVDLSLLDSSMDDMDLGDRIPCYAEPYDLDITLPIQEQTLYLQEPNKNTITLSATLKNKKATISGQVAGSGSAIRQATYEKEMTIRNVIRQEVANIMASFAGELGGYKLSEYNSDGLWVRDLYMDAPDKDDATKVMEISLNGIRFSTDGYQAATSSAWTTAWTLGGAFNADFITVGTLMGERIKAGTISDVTGNTSWNLETGDFLSKAFHLLTTYLEITTDGKIISMNGTESLTIEQAVLIGKHNGYQIGLIDLAADTDHNGTTTYDVAITASGHMRLEFGTPQQLYIYQSETPVGYFDGRGWHGDVYGTVHDEA